MMAPDTTGRRALYYRALGVTKDDITGMRFMLGPQVLVEDKHWKDLELTDRTDIRKTILRIASNAVQKLKKSGDDRFEHNVP